MRIGLAVLPLLLLVGATNVYSAEEEIEVKSEQKDGKSEFKMKVQRKGDQYVGVRDGREYVLRGESVSTINDDGEYYVSGREVDDRTFETTEIRPVTVHEHHVTTERPIEERRVIREREVVRERDDDPVFKAGPLEINP